MKHVHIILLFLALPVFSFSQWTYLNSGVTANLYSVFFVNGSLGFATSHEALLKTTDGGQTWTQVATGVNSYINNVWFTSTTTGFISGNFILKTTDQGATWTIVDSADSGYPVFYFSNIFFVNSTVGYAVKSGDSHCSLIKTIDGGNTWSSLNYDFSTIYGLFFFSADSGVVTDFDGNSIVGRVLSTADGGQSWNSILAGGYRQFTAIAGSTSKNIFTFDNGSAAFYCSYNGGKRWRHRSLPEFNAYGGMDFTSDSVGWATGLMGFNGIILHSTDSGKTWHHDDTITNVLNAIQFPMPDTGYAVGNGGVIIKYVAPCPITAVTIPAENITACVGTDVILHCENAGNNFNYQWEKDGLPISGATDQSYTSVKDEAAFDVVVTSAFGCSSTSVPISIDRLKKPKAIIMALSNTDICNTESVDLEATSGNNFSYQWKKNGSNINGSTNQIYTATTAGDYKVHITNGNGCSKTSKATSITSSCKESSLIVNEDSFILYPNPSYGNLIVQLSNDFTSSPLKISITDLLGRKLSEFKKTDSEKFFSLQLDEKMTNGIYLLTIQSLQSSWQKHFEVER